MFSFFYTSMFAGLVLAGLCLWQWGTSTPSLPPGPRRWPIIGNALDIPRERPWLTFSQWRKSYGDIASLSIFGRTIIIINSAKAAIDLLDKRSSYYSDRPRLPMGGEMVGWDHTLPMIPYGGRFRNMRSLFHHVLGPRPSQNFWPAEEHETTLFLGRLLASPEDFVDHIRHTAGAIIMKISHGYTVSEGQDKLIDLAAKAMEQFSLSTEPGTFLVDVLPWLKYVPAWFPGAGFSRIAAEWRKDLFHVVDLAHEFTKNEMKQGTALPSFTSEHLASPQTPESETMIKWTAFSMLAGGSDTTVSAMESFFLAMCTHPEVQVAAQAELDTVIGSERLPTMADRESLPYIQAILKEILRWATIAPMPFHGLTREDEYEGYRFPKGSGILANVWCMLHDPEIFPNPAEFRPERFIGPKKVEDPLGDPLQFVFGFGRRACPGRHLAEHSMYLAIAKTLATFTISKARDASGRVIEPEIVWLPLNLSHPQRFRCDIKPRSVRAVELIKQAIEQGRA